MSVSGLNHINIIASGQLLDHVLRFYTEILGLEVGQRPAVDVHGYWLYIHGKPVVHLEEGESVALGGRAALNHIAFSADDLDEVIEILEAEKISYHREDLEFFGMTQLFFNDPVGIRIELNFDNKKLRKVG